MALTVQVQSAIGAAEPVRAAATVLLTSPVAAAAFYSDPGCTVPAGEVVVEEGADSASFYFRSTVAGTHEVTASADGLLAAIQTETVDAAPAARLAFTSAPQTLSAGTCSAQVAVAVRDAFDNLAPVSANLTADLTSTSSTLAFFADAACSTPLTSITFAAGESAGGFHFRDTSVGTPMLTAQAAGLANATQGATVTPAVAIRLGFSTPAQSVVAGACSAITTLRVEDALGNPNVVAADTVVSLTSDSTTMSFHADPACSSGLTSVTLLAGAGAQSFYFRDTSAGAPALLATAASLTPGNQLETITAAAPAAIAFSSAPQSVAANGCSAATTVLVSDSFGNPAPLAAGGSGALTSTSGTMTFYSDPGCTAAITAADFAAGASSTTFHFKDSAVGTPTITVTASLGIASQAQTITVAVGKLAFTTAAQTFTAGTCSAQAVVQSQTSGGAPANVGADTTVSLTSSSPTMAFFSDAACTAVIANVTIAAASDSQAFYFTDTRVGTATVTASAAGYALATQPQTIGAAPTSRLAFTSPVQSIPSSACSALTTVQTQDAFGNVSPAAGALVIALSSSSATLAFFSDAACATSITDRTLAAGGTQVSFYFRDGATGTHTLTASTTGLTAGTQPATVGAGAAVNLGFSTPSRAAAAGACSAVLTLQSRDAASNPSPVSANTTVLLTVPPTMTLYSDASCTASITDLVIAAGTLTQSFYFRDTAAGAPVISASATGFAPAQQTQTITAATATRLVFLTTQQTLVEGVCSAVVTVQAQDAFGNPANVAAPTTVGLSSSSGTLEFHSAGTCGAPIAGPAVTIAAGSNSAGFFFRDVTAGAPTITVASTGMTSGQQTEMITSISGKKLVITTATQTLAAGACSAKVTVQARDGSNNPINVVVATAVALTSASGTMQFYSDACVTPVGSVSIATGTSAQDFYFRDTTTGTPTLTASTPGYSAANQLETINTGPVSRIGFDTAPQTVTAASCSGAVTIEPQDQYGNWVRTAAAGNLSTDSATMVLYSRADCTGTPVTSYSFTTGKGYYTYYFKDTKAGGPTLSATSTNPPLTPGSQIETIRAAPPVSLNFVTPPRTLAAGECSPASTIETRDQYLNPAPVTSDTQVSLTVGSATFAFFSDAACTTAISFLTFPAGASQGSFYFKETTMGAPAVTASATGLTPTAAQTQTVNAAAAAKLLFTTSAQTVTAGTCSAIASVQTQDPYGNVASVSAPTTATLASTAGTTQFYSDPACGTVITGLSFVSGTTLRSFYFKDDVAAPSITVSATAPGLTAANQIEAVQAAAASKVVFLTGSHTVLEGDCSPAVSVETRDPLNNPSTVTGDTTLNLSTSPPAPTLVFYSDAACTSPVTSVEIASGTPTASFYFKDPNSSTVNIAVASVFQTITQPHTIEPANPTHVVFTTPARTAAAGACSLALTVQALNVKNNPTNVLAPTQVNLTSTSGAMLFYSDPGCTAAVTSVTIATGTNSQSFYFKDTFASTPSVTASPVGLTGDAQGQTVTPATASKIAYSTSAQSLKAGLCSAAVTVQTRDPYDNPSAVSSDLTVNLTLSGTSTLVLYADPACGTPASSFLIAATTSAKSFYFRDTKAETPTITAASSLGASIPQQQTITPADPSKLVFTTTAQTITANQCSGVATVQLQDVYDNPVSSAGTTAVALSAPPSGMSFYTAATCPGADVTSVNIVNGTSSASFYFRDSVSGSKEITAASAGLTSGRQSQTINPGDPAVLVFTTTAQTVLASKCSGVVTVQSRDAFGNPTVAALAVALSKSSTPPEVAAALTLYSDAACSNPTSSANIGSGTSQSSFYFRGVTGGSVQLTATPSGLSAVSQTQTIASTVRTGTCQLSTIQSLVSCPISPALFDTTKTMLFYEAANADPNGSGANVRCLLASASSITCNRSGTGLAASIRWYTVELPSGISVRHLSTGCGGATTTLPLSPPVNLAESFVLFGSTRASSNGQTVASARVARLSASAVTIEHNSGGCGTDDFAVQVVELAGSVVTRGSATMTTASQPVSALASSDLARTMLLYSWRSGDGSACERGVRGELTSATSLGFTRSAGASGCTGTSIDEIYWERVQLPAGHAVQQVSSSLAAAAPAITKPITAVDLTRTVAFAGGQGMAGQAGGENGLSASETFGESFGVHRFTDATTLEVSRSSTSSAAAWTSFVIQFQP